ncbi:MAG: hypothetical protein Q7U38_08635 [Methylobacter sp.]|nr:hypothetical protein [Methylobacter sp.]MDP2100791.1 hypothetical protein [Methylobacter sp.]MDP2427062.1 hypothetical protein [Methylobacter sp.]MDP3053040.1 hypothetical protein [Methylobacter sp.]MDZ4218732.1 hypothetical protein [Methylobacter sp.]
MLKTADYIFFFAQTLTFTNATFEIIRLNPADERGSVENDVVDGKNNTKIPAAPLEFLDTGTLAQDNSGLLFDVKKI